MLDQTLLGEVAFRWGTVPTTFTPVAGGHFAFVYEFSLVGQACILRIIPPNADVDLEAMRAIGEWLDFLAAHGGPVPRPVRSRTGSLFELVDFQEKTYIASVTEKAPGVLAEAMALGDWDDELFQALGRTLGQCHRVAQLYVPSNPAFKRPEWDQGGSCFSPREHLAGAEGMVIDKREKVLAIIQALPEDRECYGLAHLDLHFGNFFVDAAQKKIYLFDFDDCAYGWFVMDIAMLLFDVLVVYEGADSLEFSEWFLKNLLRGYRIELPVSDFWVSQLPHFLKLLEIGVYLMLYRDYDPVTADGWVGKFMRGRRERIVQEIPYVEMNFLVIC